VSDDATAAGGRVDGLGRLGTVKDTPESWPVVSRRQEFAGRIVSAYTETITGPDGSELVREVVRHGGAVAVVAVDEEDRLLVLTQFRNAAQERLVELPAGLLDVEGEEPLAAAQRELAEEAGLGARDWSVLVEVFTSPGIMDERVVIYLAEGLSDAPPPDGFSAEHEEADMGRHWVPLADVVRGILRHEIKDSLTVSGSLALWALRHENTIG
jgi:8-oxo-dGTP pyrophosphatase MutT (NUDIX family)